MYVCVCVPDPCHARDRARAQAQLQQGRTACTPAAPAPCLLLCKVLRTPSSLQCPSHGAGWPLLTVHVCGWSVTLNLELKPLDPKQTKQMCRRWACRRLLGVGWGRRCFCIWRPPACGTWTTCKRSRCVVRHAWGGGRARQLVPRTTHAHAHLQPAPQFPPNPPPRVFPMGMSPTRTHLHPLL